MRQCHDIVCICTLWTENTPLDYICKVLLTAGKVQVYYSDEVVPSGSPCTVSRVCNIMEPVISYWVYM